MVVLVSFHPSSPCNAEAGCTPGHEAIQEFKPFALVFVYEYVPVPVGSAGSSSLLGNRFTPAPSVNVAVATACVAGYVCIGLWPRYISDAAAIASMLPRHFFAA